jgi:transposase-like protein/predicted transcriptional regulator
MSSPAASYHGYRFPPEIISHAVWLYHRFCLSFRDTEDLLAQRSITVSYEAIRQWCQRFGPEYARILRHRQGRLGDTWHLDELFVNIHGRLQYLWRAADQDGDVIDILVQPRRDRRAAERFFRKLLKGQGCAPRRLITDKLRSYPAAHGRVMPSVAPSTTQHENNRAEVAHQPTLADEANLMKWSIRIGTFAGIGVYVHATFLILIVWVALAHWQTGHNVAAAAAGVGFILALFACVVLHEFGHALTARRFGIKTRDITLLPIGGLARLERMPDDPRQELWVALAGPAVNVVIAAGLFAVLRSTGTLAPVVTLTPTGGSFLERLMILNVFLAVFNMLPAFPMDGGRVLRALLATRMEYTRATHAAATIGQGMALFFGLVGLFTNPFLIFIALFVWIGAGQEAAMTQMKAALGGIPLERAMITEFRTLSVQDSLASAVDLLLSGAQQDFPVMDGRTVVGVLTRADLLRALARQDQRSLVAEVMRRDFHFADAGDMIEVALQRLQGGDCQTIPVLRRGDLVGLLTMDNVGEFLGVQAAVQGRIKLRTAKGVA